MRLLSNDYLTTRQAAEYLEYSISSLRKARESGTLAGREAPEAERLDGRYVYLIGTLDSWLETFRI